MTATDPAGTDATAAPAAKKEGTFWHPYYAAAQPGTPKAAAGTTAGTATRTAQNVALNILWWLGAVLFAGGVITMVVGSSRKEPSRLIWGSAEDTIINSMNFAATNTLTVLIGSGIVLLGGMALVGALVVKAVRFAPSSPAELPVPRE